MQPFPGKGRFFLLRHGETEWNRQRRIMGRRPVPLSERGRAQLSALAPHLARLGIATIFTSPLARARATEIGRASCRERVEMWEVAAALERAEESVVSRR